MIDVNSGEALRKSWLRLRNRRHDMLYELDAGNLRSLKTQTSHYKVWQLQSMIMRAEQLILEATELRDAYLADTGKTPEQYHQELAERGETPRGIYVTKANRGPDWGK
jgi:hypothetical protein